MKEKKVSQSFVKGALIMTLGMLFVKIAGAVFKIPLLSIIGGEGFGYFSDAYSLYIPIYALASAGLPIAISRMVSSNMAKGRYKDVRLLKKISAPMFILMGLIGSFVMIVGSFFYIKYAKTPGSLYPIIALAPTVFFSCLISIYKGYFEGLRNMIPTAVSEIVEAVGKIIFGIAFANASINYGMNEYKNYGTVLGKVYESAELAKGAILPYAAAGAVLGITIGAFFGFLYIFLKYKISGDGITKEEFESAPEPMPRKTLVSALFKIAIPVALGAIVMNLATVIDAMLVKRRLFAIMEIDPMFLVNFYKGLIPEAVISEGRIHIFLSGCFSGMNSVIMMIPAITSGFSISALPVMTAAWVSGVVKQTKKNMELILKMASLVAIPAGLGLSFLAHPIMNLIYSAKPQEAFIGAEIMKVTGLAVIFIALATPICSMLQAVGRADLPVKILSIGVVLKIVLNYILVAIPEINIQGAGIGTLVCYSFVCGVSLYFLCKETKIVPNLFEVFLKPAFCALICAETAYVSQSFLSKVISYRISTVLSIAIACVIYVLVLFLTQTLHISDLNSMPKLKKFFKRS